MPRRRALACALRPVTALPNDTAASQSSPMRAETAAAHSVSTGARFTVTFTGPPLYPVCLIPSSCFSASAWWGQAAAQSLSFWQANWSHWLQYARCFSSVQQARILQSSDHCFVRSPRQPAHSPPAPVPQALQSIPQGASVAISLTGLVFGQLVGASAPHASSAQASRVSNFSCQLVCIAPTMPGMPSTSLSQAAIALPSSS